MRAAVDRGSLLVEVSDEGPGVPDDLRDRIFDPYVTTGGTAAAQRTAGWASRSCVATLWGGGYLGSSVGQPVAMCTALTAPLLSLSQASPWSQILWPSSQPQPLTGSKGSSSQSR